LQSKKKLVRLIKNTLQKCSAQNLTENILSIKNSTLIIGKHKINLGKYKNIYLFGSGKAAGNMALGAENILRNYLTSGFIITNSLTSLKKTEICNSSHPVPDLKTFQATNTLFNKIHEISKNDFFIYLLSGGTSSMVELPVFPFTINELSVLNKKLVKSGMNIDEINTIRKCYSSVKGGKLAEDVVGNGIVLVLSDVLGNSFETIGSAPLFPTTIKYKKALHLINKYKINLSDKFLSFLDKKNKTIKNYNNFPHIIIGGNDILLDTCQRIVEEAKSPVFVYKKFLVGEAKTKGKEIADILLKKAKTTTETSYFIFGGETTVTVKGKGKGGRNQEMVLSALKYLNINSQISLISIGSDGIDGFTNVSGAFINHLVYKESQNLNLNIDEYLDNNNSYNFFKKTNSHIKLGATGNNLLDICIAEIKPVCSKHN